MEIIEDANRGDEAQYQDNGDKEDSNSDGEAQYQDNADMENADSDGEEYSTGVVVSGLSDETSPYEAFDITECSTFEHLWDWDIFLTCNEDGSECSCTFANNLMEKGSLSCRDASRCQPDCQICFRCLHIVGCPNVSASGRVTAISGGSSVLTSLAYFTIFLAVAACMMCKKTNNGSDNSSLKSQLVDPEYEMQTGQNIWMVPVEPVGSQHKHGVWLVPDTVAGSESSSQSSIRDTQTSMFNHKLESSSKTRWQNIFNQNISSMIKGSLSNRLPSSKAVSQGYVFNRRDTAPVDRLGNRNEVNIGGAELRPGYIQEKCSNPDLGEGHDRSKSSLFPDLLPAGNPPATTYEREVTSQKQDVFAIPIDLTSQSHSSQGNDSISRDEDRPIDSEDRVWMVPAKPNLAVLNEQDFQTDEENNEDMKLFGSAAPYLAVSVASSMEYQNLREEADDDVDRSLMASVTANPTAVENSTLSDTSLYVQGLHGGEQNDEDEQVRVESAALSLKEQYLGEETVEQANVELYDASFSLNQDTSTPCEVSEQSVECLAEEPESPSGIAKRESKNAHEILEDVSTFSSEEQLTSTSSLTDSILN